MPHKKIAFIHPFQLRLQRGIEVWLWYLASNLAKQGLEVHILTWDGPLEVPGFCVHPNLIIKRVPTCRYLQHWLAVPYYLYYLIREHYDHIFVNFACYGEGLSLAICSLFSKCTFSLVLHFPQSLVPHRYKEFLHWRFHKKAKHIIAVSQAVADEAANLFGVDCVVIGHGVDGFRYTPDQAIRNQIREKLGISGDAFVLISAAAFEERKGMQWVIRAMPQILTKAPDTFFLIVGEGNYRAELEHLVRLHNLIKNVKFLGHQENVIPFYQAADLMMLLSYGEASPLSIPEAFACQLPVIVSKNPPFPELVDPSCGVLVDEKDSKAVADAVIDLFKDRDRRIFVGKNARKYAMKHHDWQVVAHQYLDLLESTSG